MADPAQCAVCGVFNTPGSSRCECGASLGQAIAPVPLLLRGGFVPGFATALPTFVIAALVLRALGDAGKTLALPLEIVGFGTLALVLSRHAVRPNWSGAAGILVGIALGLAIDMSLAAGHESHSLWPFEVATYFMFLGPAVAAGTQVAGERVRRR